MPKEPDFTLVHEKTDQAIQALGELGLGAWLLMGRETIEMADPSLALVVGTTVTWTSIFLITASGERTAIVGTYDKPNLETTGNFTYVVDYVGSPKDALLEALGRAADTVAASPKNNAAARKKRRMYTPCGGSPVVERVPGLLAADEPWTNKNADWTGSAPRLVGILNVPYGVYSRVCGYEGRRYWSWRRFL